MKNDCPENDNRIGQKNNFEIARKSIIEKIMCPKNSGNRTRFSFSDPKKGD